MTGGGKGHHSRHRRPGQVKALEGNRAKLGKARIKSDPKGVGSPRLPRRLTAVERELFDRVVASLPEGLLSQADEAALEQFAIEWALFREADDQIKASTLLVDSPQGPIRNPLLVIRNTASKTMTSIGSNLGLSPVARARLSAPGSSKEDPMEQLLGMDGDPAGAWSTLPKTKQ